MATGVAEWVCQRLMVLASVWVHRHEILYFKGLLSTKFIKNSNWTYLQNCNTVFVSSVFNFLWLGSICEETEEKLHLLMMRSGSRMKTNCCGQGPSVESKHYGPVRTRRQPEIGCMVTNVTVHLTLTTKYMFCNCHQCVWTNFWRHRMALNGYLPAKN